MTTAKSMNDNDSPLQEAFSAGDISRLRDLIAAGADIHYKRDEGYDALIDAVHGPDATLLDVLRLLIDHGVDLNGESSYGETGLRVLSRMGRFDGVRLLVNAGADKQHIQWTPLLEAVALGSLHDVRTILTQGADLEARDYWSRTAWLISLLCGDMEKATLLREYGADTNARGRCSKPPLFYAIEGHHPAVLRWLIQSGADTHAMDEFANTPLMHAVDEGDLDCVNILLEAGANVESDKYGSIIGQARSREMVLRLLEAGADPADISYEAQRNLLELGEIDPNALDAVSADDFRSGHARVFGKDNPERMHVPFWNSMIRAGVYAYTPWAEFAKEGDGTSRPVWCAMRFGQSLTFLPDGRAIQIGGEHEDFYDADFCIYNDVFVHERDGSIAIYGYPESVFPPTDFHTATLLGEYIYVIGSLGYYHTRQFGVTLVYRLHIPTLRMERVDTQGDGPGWIYEHRASVTSSHEIRVWGGKTMMNDGDGEDTPAAFVLNVETLVWRREVGESSPFSGGDGS